MAGVDTGTSSPTNTTSPHDEPAKEVEVLVAASVATPMAAGRTVSIPVGQPFQITQGLDGQDWLVVDLVEDE